MNYTASVFDFFKSPKWGMNLLLGGVCVLIPIVGPLALMGWYIGGLYGRQNWRDFVTFPDFDFGKFGQNLERGVWPFLMQLVVSVALMPVMFVFLFAPMMTMAAMLPHPGPNSPAPHEMPPAMLAMIPMMIFGYMAVIALMVLVSKPLMIRAALTQDFAKSFNWAFVKSFTAKTWLHQLVSMLFLILVALVLMLLGVIACGVGCFFTMSIVTFAHWHLDRQLYDLYLARGGEPVPVSPKISDSPPALPGQAHS